MLIEGQAVMDTVNTVVVMVHDTASDAQMEATREEIRRAGLIPVVIRGASFQIAWSAGTPRIHTPKPTEPTEIKHAAYVELLRREVRAWRSQHQAMENGASNDKWEAILMERDAARKAVDVSGALG